MATKKPLTIYNDEIETGEVETIRLGDTLDVPIDWNSITNKPHAYRGVVVYCQSDPPIDPELNDIWIKI